MSDEKPIKKVTVAVACVVAGSKRRIGDDVDVSAEDGKYLVGSGRAVRADTDEAKAIKAGLKKAG